MRYGDLYVKTNLQTMLTLADRTIILCITRPHTKEDSMDRTQTTCRFSKATVKRMDQLIADPPAELIDALRGGPRSRTELIELLVFKAAEWQQDKPKTSKPAKG